MWLGLRNDSTSYTGDHKEIDKLKSDMSARYEKRRYYVEPSADMFDRAKAQNAVDTDKKNNASTNSKGSRPFTYAQVTSLIY